jgi:DNA primase
MGKIAPVSAKYIIHVHFQADGIVEKPDVIGAVFGQTEGLLGSELELRELQKSGRIGRIEVELDTKRGKTSGEILIPSSLDKTETAIIAAAMETIQRVGPCNSTIDVKSIDDVRTSKREQLLERAKDILKNMIGEKMPDSGELSDEVQKSARALEIAEYGPDRLPCGPGIEDEKEIIVVEGRADVITLLRHGIKNVIAMNGTEISNSIVPICKNREVTLFLDGDRGGNLILKGMMQLADVDFVAWAPAGKEVEELTKKEIHQSLRGKTPIDQVKKDMGRTTGGVTKRVRTKKAIDQNSATFKSMLDELTGTRGAYILDEELNILGKVPSKELSQTLKSLKKAFAIVLDGEAERGLLSIAERRGVKYIVATKSSLRSRKVKIITESDLE